MPTPVEVEVDVEVEVPQFESFTKDAREAAEKTAQNAAAKEEAPAETESQQATTKPAMGDDEDWDMRLQVHPRSSL